MQTKKTKEDLFHKEFFKQFKNTEDFQGYSNSLFKHGIEEMLQGELEEHLGYSKHAKEGYNSGSSRNRSFPKTINTENVLTSLVFFF
jgi:transposase-like protein